MSSTVQAVLRLLRVTMLAALAAGAALAHASGLQVVPTLVQIDGSAPAQAVWLTNTGSEELRAQVRPFFWTQPNGEDLLEPTRTLAVSPPMLTLAPGATQLIRVIRTGKPPAAGQNEEAYRILIDELPLPGKSELSGIQYVMRYSVPVFVGGAVPDAKSVAANLQVSARIEDGHYAVHAQNTGTVHAQLSRLALEPTGLADAPVVLSSGLIGYVLPGSTMRWVSGKAEKNRDVTEQQVTMMINGQAAMRTAVTEGGARR